MSVSDVNSNIELADCHWLDALIGRDTVSGICKAIYTGGGALTGAVSGTVAGRLG